MILKKPKFNYAQFELYYNAKLLFLRLEYKYHRIQDDSLSSDEF